MGFGGAILNRFGAAMPKAPRWEARGPWFSLSAGYGVVGDGVVVAGALTCGAGVVGA
jgi:hypothetical protein